MKYLGLLPVDKAVVAQQDLGALLVDSFRTRRDYSA
jgi:hypothetical protein